MYISGLSSPLPLPLQPSLKENWGEMEEPGDELLDGGQINGLAGENWADKMRK